ncbi:MAG: DUF362 domain-containing protein [Candidatus Aminicenantes bacterium]|nr:DUF362 domain-containing protein [Candidatus Aminicenantes bacterium]
MRSTKKADGLSRRDFFRALGAGLTIPYLGKLNRLPRVQTAAVKNDLFWVKHIPDHPFYDPGRQNHHIGLDSLLYLMGDKGLRFYRSSSGHPFAGPSGLIAADDVVLIKVNAQWKHRGCTNSDLIRGLIQRVLDHPDGFHGEVVIVENGQGRGSFRCDTSAAYGGDKTVHANANDESHHYLYLVNTVFNDARVSAYLLDPIRGTFIGDNDHAKDGYRKFENVSYPCFTTVGGRRVELKEGVWQAGVHRGNLKLINVPVLKHHDTGGSEITAGLKHVYGLVSMDDGQSSFRHYSGLGETCGKMMVSVRTPVLNIIDAIWVSHDTLGGYPAGTTFRANQLLAGQDPVAADYWAAKYILYPVDGNFRHHPDFLGISRWLKDAENTINGRGGLLDPEKGILVGRVTGNENEMAAHVCGAGEFLHNIRLSVSESGLRFGASVSMTGTLEKPLSISISGANALSWRAETDAAWLGCAPSSGSADRTIAVTVNPSGLEPGEHRGQILIHCPGAANTPQLVAVLLIVREGRGPRRAELKSKF